MIRSMTGFGRATGTIHSETVTVEVTAVNHRFLECSFRMPGAWMPAEPALRECVKKHLSRGKVNVSVRRDKSAQGRTGVKVDLAVAKQYIDGSRELADAMSAMDKLSLNTLMQLEGVFSQEEDERGIDEVQAGLCSAMDQALEQLNAHRAVEGKALADDMAARVTAMREALVVIQGRIPDLSKAYEDRLRARIKELTTELNLSEERIAIEIAVMAEKADVNEEVVRLRAHFEHVDQLLASADSIGREMNFLTQEIQREITTLGSKLRDLDVSREVMKVKTELEKLREQVQNIE